MLQVAVRSRTAVDGILIFRDALPQLHPAVSVALNSTSSNKVAETVKARVSVTQSTSGIVTGHRVVTLASCYACNGM
jgi:hypothetical protein